MAGVLAAGGWWLAAQWLRRSGSMAKQKSSYLGRIFNLRAYIYPKFPNFFSKYHFFREYIMFFREYIYQHYGNTELSRKCRIIPENMPAYSRFEKRRIIPEKYAGIFEKGQTQT